MLHIVQKINFILTAFETWKSVPNNPRHPKLKNLKNMSHSWKSPDHHVLVERHRVKINPVFVKVLYNRRQQACKWEAEQID